MVRSVFYTYVWGGFGNKATPLTFTTKANRTQAVSSTEEGDIAFGVVSRNPSDPSVIIEEEKKGRVLIAWQVSHMTADTADFDIEIPNEWDRLSDGSYRWPYSMQPIRAWSIENAPEFRLLPDYLPTTHTQRAITTLQKIEGGLAQNLLDLLDQNGTELEVLTPRYRTVAARVQTLKQKHPFALKGYHVTPDSDAMYRIYIATLGKNARTLKIGHARDAAKRVSEFNKFRLSSEPQWVLHTNQPIGTVTEAIEVEKRVGEIFAKHRTEPNNNEIYYELDPMTVLRTLATF